MAIAIMAEAAEEATRHMEEADHTLEYYCKRLRALGRAIETLLPKDAFAHPVLAAAEGTALDRPDRNAIYDLRDAVIAARELAGMVDDAACVMSDQVADQMLQARRAIGLPDPAGTTVSIRQEARHV